MDGANAGVDGVRGSAADPYPGGHANVAASARGDGDFHAHRLSHASAAHHYRPAAHAGAYGH